MRLAWKSDLGPGVQSSDPLYLGCRSIASDGTLDQERIARGQNRHQRQSGRAPESVNHELIFLQISPLGDLATQSMTSSSHEKCRCTQMPNSNDVASNEMLWERVLSLLVVGASVLGGSAVLLIQALPLVLHGFP